MNHWKNILIYALALLMLAGCNRQKKATVKAAVATRNSTSEPVKSPAAVSAAGQVSFRATGNEPFWLLEADFNRFIHFKLIEGPDITTPVTEAAKTTNAGITRYTVHTEQGSLVVQLQKPACVNDMSGTELPYTVTVEAKTLSEKEYKRYKGCGDYLSIPGSDMDEQGCKTSAGYQWSAIRNKCIRVFEEGRKLNPLEAAADKTTAAYIVFSGDNSKAELFLLAEKGSVILERKAEGEAWVQGEWMLIAWKGYVLKKNDVAVYGGE